MAAAKEKVAYAPEDPLWELRLGATALYGPDYPGADQKHLNGLAAPLFIYRGDRIRFGDYGIARAIAEKNKRFELDVSLDAAFPANSDDNDARLGMPDLDVLLQIGPQAIVHAYDTGWTTEGRDQINIRVPVRAVAATDFSRIEHVGYLAEPSISFRRQWNGERRSGVTATLFATWADEGLMDYYYEVAPVYAAPGRPAYDAEAGYLGAGINISASRELSDNFQVYLTWQGRTFEGANNKDSPLLRSDFTSAVSFSFVWKLLQSSRPAIEPD